MAIAGTEGMSGQELAREIEKGGRFVYFQYCVSVIILTFRRSSQVFFIKSGESAFAKGLPYSLLSLLLGWWGVPWGFIYTPMVLYQNSAGGIDVTAQFMASARSAPPSTAGASSTA